MKYLSAKALSLLLTVVLIFTAFIPCIAAEATAQQDNAIKLSSDVITYTSLSEKCMQLPCEELGGIYFLNDSELIFFDLENGTGSQVHSFGYLTDAYYSDGLLYALVYDFNTSAYSVSIYSLKEQKTVNTFTIDADSACAVGADSSGNIFIASSTANDEENYPFYIYKNTGELLTESVFDSFIYSFSGFDSTNGNFYFECYYNFLYWGYEHDMHAIGAGNYSNAALKFADNLISLISQSYFYEQQNALALIGNKYLCSNNTLNSCLEVWDSNAYSSAAEDYSPLYTVTRITEDEYDSLANVGPRAVYLSKNDTVAAVDEYGSITEYQIEQHSVICSYSTAYPVFSLLNYGENIAAIERNGDDFYLELISVERAKTIKLKADNTTIPEAAAVQLSVEYDIPTQYPLSWTSSAPSVASVTSTGKVYAYSEGTTEITVNTTIGLTDTITITVTPGSFADSDTANIFLDAAESYNISGNNYRTWASTVYSYLTQTDDGKLMRVEYIDDAVIIEYYSVDGKLESSKTLKPPLSLFGGFFCGENAYYLVFGEINSEESDECEVLRVVKYDKSWKKLAECPVYGANTHIPFDAGSLRMTETDGKLYIHTCHEMYVSSDGLHHQANMSYVINESKMAVEDSYYEVMNIAQAGYVSHSFNQFILTDGDYVYRVDHGDAHLRAVSITKCSVTESITDVEYTAAFDICGESGLNATGVSVGGFEASENNLLFAGNTADQSKQTDSYASGIRNIFVCITDKELKKSNTVMLTEYAEDSDIEVNTPQLVKINDNFFLVMWEEWQDEHIEVKAVTIDDQGNKISDIISCAKRLSDCKPILCSDGIVRWYATDSRFTVLYSINPFNLYNDTAYTRNPQIMFIAGDIDGNGAVSAADARLALRASVNLEQLSFIEKFYADADGDDTVTAGDARLILRAAVGLEYIY